MSLDLTISIQGKAWESRKAAFTDLARLCLQAVLREEKITRPVSVAAVLGGDDFIRALNRDYRGKDKPTNVLAFPDSPAQGALGDLIVSGETVLREAREQGKEPSHHLAHLLVHGGLHLLGHDHMNEAEAARMESKEIKILKHLGVANPYL